MATYTVADGHNGLLNLRVAMIDWGREPGPGDGGVVTHLRWMMPTRAGVPLVPFQVSLRHGDDGSTSKQEIANLDGWEPVETVGLPMLPGWSGGVYQGDEQGLEGSPEAARDAAVRRLQVGAPRRGWPAHAWSGHPLTSWQEADLEVYLDSVAYGRLMSVLGDMLGAGIPPGRLHAQDIAEAGQGPIVLGAHLQPGFGQSPAAWNPMQLLSLAAASDPLAALAFGYGTAYENENSELLYRVSVTYSPNPGLPPIELADVARVTRLAPGLPRPANLRTRRSGYTRPQETDGPAVESVAVLWDRPATEPAPLGEEQPGATAYAIGRFDPVNAEAELLLSPRPDGVGGYLACVPGRTAGSDAASRYTDHVTRTAADVAGFSRRYAVAGRDLYGRWSGWRDVGYDGAPEHAQKPSVLSVQVAEDRALVVDFSWDWSDRSPAFIELSVALGGPNPLTMRFDFVPDGTSPTPGLAPLRFDRTPAAGWGVHQDREPGTPGARHYRWTSASGMRIQVPRGGYREVAARARGRARLHQWVSDWSRAATTRVWDKTKPPLPHLETPRWASLPDAAGVSRFDMKWQAEPTAANGYFVYEATETSVRDAFGLGPADLSVPVTTRLNQLLAHPAADFAGKVDALRRTFHRVTMEALPASARSHEVALPRGSRLLHFLTVTGVGGNGEESQWPTRKEGYSIVAVPKLAVPLVPAVALKPVPNSSVIGVEVDLRSGGGLVELHRLRGEVVPLGPDAMGPPIRRKQFAGPKETIEDSAPFGWRRIWYCATVRSAADDMQGIVSTRAASAPAAILHPPPGPPEIMTVRVNELRSTATESLVGWSIAAPLPATSVGPHTAVAEVRERADAAVLDRIERRLDALPLLAATSDLVPPANPTAPRLVAVPELGGHRLYAWVARQAGALRHVTLKLIDPLGRLTVETAGVPPVVYSEIGWTANAVAFRGRIGERFHFVFGPRTGELGRIWGTRIYTDDSPIALAAVHGGFATLRGGRVAVEIVAGQSSYVGSEGYGVTSLAYGPWTGSYRFVGENP